MLESNTCFFFKLQFLSPWTNCSAFHLLDVLSVVRLRRVQLNAGFWRLSISCSLALFPLTHILCQSPLSVFKLPTTAQFDKQVGTRAFIICNFQIQMNILYKVQHFVLWFSCKVQKGSQAESLWLASSSPEAKMAPTPWSHLSSHSQKTVDKVYLHPTRDTA